MRYGARLASGGLMGLVLAMLFVSGCGGSDGERASTQQGSDASQIRAVLTGIQQDFNNLDGEAYCDKIIAKEKQDVVVFGRNFGRGTTCADVVTTTARQTRDAGIVQKPTKMLAVRVRGTRASVRVSNGGRPAEWMMFAKEDGTWKVVESGFEPDPLVAAQREADKDKKGKQ